MGIIQIFKVLNYIWLLLIAFQLIIVVLSNREVGVKSNIIKDFYTDSSAEVVKKNQPFLFIIVYNTVLMVLYLIIHSTYCITIGIQIGALLLYLSFAGDLGELLFCADKSEHFLNSIEFKNLIIISLSSAVLGILVHGPIIRELKDCPEFYALVEMALLMFFAYLYIYYFITSLYLILGHIYSNANNNVKGKIDTLKMENSSLQSKMESFTDNIDYKAEKMTTGKRLVLFIPMANIFILIVILNYIMQLFRDIRLISLYLIDKWIESRRVSLRADRLKSFITRTSHLSIIIVLCAAYIWLTFIIGADSNITKIIYGFSTIIIIPIAINRISSRE